MPMQMALDLKDLLEDEEVKTGGINSDTELVGERLSSILKM